MDKVLVKPTWGLAWGLFWRWFIISSVLYVPLIAAIVIPNVARFIGGG